MIDVGVHQLDGDHLSLDETYSTKGTHNNNNNNKKDIHGHWNDGGQTKDTQDSPYTWKDGKCEWEYR
jgi:hypothetical protein